MIINKTLLQNAEPKNGNVLWAQPVGDKLQLKAYNKGKWSDVAGSGSSDKTIIGDDYIPLNTLLKFDLDQDQWNNMSLDEINEYIAQKFKNVSISTRKHGDIINICASGDSFVYLCSDGYMLTEAYDQETQTVYYKELAPYLRYQIRTLQNDTTNYLAVVDAAYEKVVPLKDVADLTNVIYASDLELGNYSSNLSIGYSIIFYLKHHLSHVSVGSENQTYWDSNTKTSGFEMVINFGRNNNSIQITNLNNGGSGVVG